MQFKTLSALTLAAGLTSAMDHVVKVGDGGLNFNPNSVNASKGDTVTFHFYPMKHSVVQAAFATPCQPMDNGFYSGFMPVASGMGNETFMITVEDATKPIWFYCSQGKHCQSGMVGVINEQYVHPLDLMFSMMKCY
jgi:plastocyanin